MLLDKLKKREVIVKKLSLLLDEKMNNLIRNKKIATKTFNDLVLKDIYIKPYTVES